MCCTSSSDDELCRLGVVHAGHPGRRRGLSPTTGAAGAVEVAGITKIQVITQAAYDALGAKDATTLYVITG